MKLPKAWGYGPKTAQRARQRHEGTLAIATLLGLWPINTYFAPVAVASANAPPKATSASHEVGPAATHHRFNTVALGVAYDAISSRLKALPNQRKSSTTFQDCSFYEVQRLNAVCVYFKAVLDGTDGRKPQSFVR